MPSPDNKQNDYTFQEVVDTIGNWLRNHYDPADPQEPQAIELADLLADAQLVTTETAWGVRYPSGLFGEVSTQDAGERCVKSIEDDPYFEGIHPEVLRRGQTPWRKA